jgi:KDO2-lipid IV(A) lauroyltransferase
LRANLRRVVGPDLSEAGLDALTRRGLRSYARYFREVFWLPTARPDVVAGRTRVSGASNVSDVRAQGRGVVCALPHTGNWDAAAVAYLAQFGPPVCVVAERLRPESLYQRFQAYRESLGMVVVPLTGGERPSAPLLALTLKAGGTVCLPCERDLSNNGVPVTFFGSTITVPPGPALLAVQTGAALIPTYAGFDGDDWTIRFFPEVVVDGPGTPKRLRDKVSQAMQKVVDQLAIGVAQAPEDWHMMQRLWQEDLAIAPTGLLSR